MRALGTTCVDLVQWHAEARRKFLLHIGAGLVLGQKVLFEDVVLVLGEAGFDIAAGLLGRRGCCRRAPAGIHGGAHSGNTPRAASDGRKSRGDRCCSQVVVVGAFG